MLLRGYVAGARRASPIRVPAVAAGARGSRLGLAALLPDPDIGQRDGSVGGHAPRPREGQFSRPNSARTILTQLCIRLAADSVTKSVCGGEDYASVVASHWRSRKHVRI